MPFTVTVLDTTRIKTPPLLGRQGYIRLLPVAALDLLPVDGVRLWCHQFARYGLPTCETVEWLRHFIHGRRAIEIGAGAGDLAHFLQIPATDSRLQERPDIELIYRMTGQPTIQYPQSVQKLDALEAIEVHQPQVVVGSWITEWIDPALSAPPDGGNIYGVKEGLLLDTGVTYVALGNKRIHGGKAIMRRPHEEHDLPFLRSRGERGMDRLWVWHGDRG